MTHADRDGSERELSAYLAADKAEPAPDADRVSTWAEAMHRAMCSCSGEPDYTHRAMARAASALADREIAEATEHCKPAEDAWRELVADKDARIAELEAKAGQLRGQVYAEQIRIDNHRLYEGDLRKSLADERAKVARVEALAKNAPLVPVHAGGGNLVRSEHMVSADDLRAALAGDA